MLIHMRLAAEAVENYCSYRKAQSAAVLRSYKIKTAMSQNFSAAIDET